jgi:DNA-binding beta-propeller fold protein YncE
MSTSRIAHLLAGAVATLLLAACGAGESSERATAATASTGSAAAGNPLTGQGLPNPAPNVTRNWGQLPAGRKWGTTAGVDIDPIDGNVWAYERCGAPAAGGAGGGAVDCETNPVDPIFKFDRNTGAVLANFGKGVMVTPHGISVDKDGNVWIADFSGNKANTKGHQVHKFSPKGEKLLSLGIAGKRGNADGQFNQPNDVIVGPDGSIYVSQGHNDAGGPQVIWKFTKDGKPLTSFGKFGHERGEFDQPHALAFDSKGRLFVGDRNNNRIQIFDQNGKLLDVWYQFSRPSGLFIDKHDMLYSADSESVAVSRNHFGWKNGIRIGSVKDGKVIAFIPDPATNPTNTSAAEGVAADDAGNIYGAEVGPRALKKYVKQ